MKARSSLPRLAIVLGSICLICSCTHDDSRSLFKSGRLLMGTLVEITLVGERNRAVRVVTAVAEEMKRVEALTSFHDTSSALSEINTTAGLGETTPPKELFDLVGTSMRFAKETGGAFDPTVGPVAKLWQFSAGEPVLPDETALRTALKKVGWKRVDLDSNAGTVRLTDPEMALDLGAIAKGYALDRAAQKIRDSGISAGLINAGGDIIAIGEKEPGSPWRVGVQNPDKHGSIIAVVTLKDRAIVTSGDYERFFVKDNIRYHHILDPRTGYPARGLRSVTIVGPDGVTADALATGVFVLGLEEGMKKIESTPEVEGLLIDSKGSIHLSSGAKSLFKLSP
jgi:FAD:protein FMN transferase